MMYLLTVQTADGVWQGEVDSWTALVILASLSAEPESLDELAEAVRRYLPRHRLFGWIVDPAEPNPVGTHGPWCLIDLVGRTVVAADGFDLPDRNGAFQADEEDHAEGFPIVWLFRQASPDCRTVVAERAAARAAVPRLDTRSGLCPSLWTVVLRSTGERSPFGTMRSRRGNAAHRRACCASSRRDSARLDVTPWKDTALPFNRSL